MKELRELLSALHLRLTAAQYEEHVLGYFKEFDRDHSGAVSWEEFLVLFARVFAPSQLYGAELRRAAGRGDEATVRDLVGRGCDPNVCDGRGWTAVHHAAEYGRTEMIKLLQTIMGAALDIDAEDTCAWCARPPPLQPPHPRDSGRAAPPPHRRAHARLCGYGASVATRTQDAAV